MEIEEHIQNQNQNQNQSKQEEEHKIDNTEAVVQVPGEQQEGLPVSDQVNQVFVKQLLEMSYSKNVSEKALFLTGNKSIEAALTWIEDNAYEADFQEELRIVQKKPLTEEEKKKKLIELEVKIKRMREEKKERERKEEEEREKQRVLGGKKMNEMRGKLEEETVKRDMYLRQIEKQKDAQAMQAIKEQLARDKAQRFGKQYDPATGKEVSHVVKTPLQNAQLAIQQLITAHTDKLFPGMAKTALSTIRIFLNNIAQNPNEEKFRKINLSNPNFQTKVAATISGIQILKICGYEEEAGFLIMKKVDAPLLKSVITELDQTIAKI